LAERSRLLAKPLYPLSYTRFLSFLTPFAATLAGASQSPEPHPYTQPKRTAKVEEKAESKKPESKIPKVFSKSENTQISALSSRF
jgi:hypothetical protein